MSNLESRSELLNPADCGSVSAVPVMQRIEASVANLGEGMAIRRALPTRHRRLIGAWCFLDHFGPVDVSATRGMRVGPHPHIGLQTVTWLMSGEVLHRDSLGSLKVIQPGQLNLMTSGRGISHSEESPQPRSPLMHGVQFWIALPESRRHGEPAFDHYPALPVLDHQGARITVLAGQALGQRSPAQVYTPLVGLDVQLPGGAQPRLPLDPAFEHGVLVTQGGVSVDGQDLAPGTLLYLGCGRDAVSLAAAAAARLVLIGGQPFNETPLMWWNFVGRTREELVQASREWNAGAAHFGQVHGYDGERLTAPLPPWASAPDAG